MARSSRLGCETGKTKVEYFDRAGAFFDQQVRWLDVTMYQSILMCVLQTQRGLPHVIAGAADRQGANVLHHLSKVLPLDILHCEIVNFAILRAIVAHNNVGMSQSSHGPYFAVKPCDGRSAGEALFVDNLEGNDAFHTDMARFVD